MFNAFQNYYYSKTVFMVFIVLMNKFYTFVFITFQRPYSRRPAPRMKTIYVVFGSYSRDLPMSLKSFSLYMMCWTQNSGEGNRISLIERARLKEDAPPPPKAAYLLSIRTGRASRFRLVFKVSFKVAICLL